MDSAQRVAAGVKQFPLDSHVVVSKTKRASEYFAQELLDILQKDDDVHLISQTERWVDLHVCPRLEVIRIILTTQDREEFAVLGLPGALFLYRTYTE